MPAVGVITTRVLHMNVYDDIGAPVQADLLSAQVTAGGRPRDCERLMLMNRDRTILPLQTLVYDE